MKIFVNILKLFTGQFVPDPAAMEMVMSMGFTKEQATKALKATDNNLERAADWAFSHISELDDTEMSVDQPPEPIFKDGKERKFFRPATYLKLI